MVQNNHLHNQTISGYRHTVEEDLGTHAIIMINTGEKLQGPSKNTNDVLTYIVYKRHLYSCISGLKKSYKHGTRIVYIPLLQ